MNGSIRKSGVAGMLISAILLSSCSKEEYVPVNADTESCEIAVEVLGADGRSLLNDRKFVNRIAVEGNNSHSGIDFDLRTVGTHRYIVFKADLPDRNEMKWDKNRSEAKGISKVTLRIDKEKIEFSCGLRFVANRPPANTGGRLTLEEVTYRHRTVGRTDGRVTITLRIDPNGKIN